MPNNELNCNAPHVNRLKSKCRESRRLRHQRWLALSLFAMIVLLSLLALSGCATPVPPPCEPLKPAAMPALVLSVPSQSYQASAAEWLKKWQEMLINVSATGKP